MIQVLTSALLQVGVVLLIAAMVWLAMRRPERFGRFVGLYRAPFKAVAIGLAAGAAAAFLLTRIPPVQAVAASEGTVVGEIAAALSGSAAIAALAIKALLQTSLSEELLFRGLIGRTLIRRIGFPAGNAIQAILFGLVHLVLLFVPGATTGLVVGFVLFATAAGWALGWLNEKRADGSILPGWAAHGAGNFVAYLALAGMLG